LSRTTTGCRPSSPSRIRSTTGSISSTATRRSASRWSASSGGPTPIHDHTVWGLIGILRGAERCRFFERTDGGRLEALGEERLEAGQVSTLGPLGGDIHEVANAYANRVSVAVHVYGGNIGAVARHVYDAATGAAKSFVSGYASPRMPNLWDRSAEVRAGLG
jgi:predicted metal-dependent enzyme (double-stranded beta helix superfamily)